jgi:hypothetical protein
MLPMQPFLYIPMHRQSSARQLPMPSSQPILSTRLRHLFLTLSLSISWSLPSSRVDNSISIVATCGHAKGMYWYNQSLNRGRNQSNLEKSREVLGSLFVQAVEKYLELVP